ncbi:MAG: TetR/AcrR family transcriptional regulator [Myxococcales bacterium]|nr:TetR/AcrR family transcriptional regulator [Myxococcales bacterium]
MVRASRPELKEAIIRVSVELGSQLGEEGLTMRAIAKRLGISATALYQHFDSKAAILQEIRLYGLRLVQDEIINPVAKIDDPIDRLREWGMSHIRFALSHRWLYGVIMESEQLNFAEMNEDELRSVVQPITDLRGWLREGRERGSIGDHVDPDMCALRLIATIHGLSSLLLAGRLDEDHPAAPIRDLSAFINEFVESMICPLRPEC